ncbi:MAG TPA: hypothetical protein VFF06_24475 [Polyangia bacterium]|nr:hypothetical protein [Polyangia bacterium]
MDVEKRLQALRREYETGQKMLAELDEKRAGLTKTLLRIEGAMQVLEEILHPQAGAPPAEANEPARAAAQLA